MLPITLLTGFLGSGKTTLVRRLLASPWGKRIGILLNERGVAGIDDLGVVEAGFIELAEGCVCCVDQPDLEAALRALSARGNLDRILLETTGLADPLPITWSVTRPDLARIVSLEAVVAVVDVENLAAKREAEWLAQVRCADVVVLSKLDRVDDAAKERARAAVMSENPTARLLDGDEALLALVGDEVIFGERDGARVPSIAADESLLGTRPHARHGDFQTVSLRGSGRYHADRLEDFIEELPPEVFRAKGIVHLEDGRWLSFQAVGGRAQIELDAGAPAHGESRLLAFGRRLDEAAIASRFRECESDESPRDRD